MKLREGRIEAGLMRRRLKRATREGMTNDEKVSSLDANTVIEETDMKVR